jgi:hypothetical protein
LEVEAEHTGAVVGEILAQGLRLCPFKANDSSAGTRHRKICKVRQTMDFDNVSEHWWLVVGGRWSVVGDWKK